MTTDNKILHRLITVLLCVCMCLPLFSVESHAASAIIWDGKAEIKSGRTYYVLGEIKVKTTITIPEDSKISVRDGAKMTISSKGKMIVRGELSAAIGGTIVNYGSLSVKKGGKLNVYGSMQSSVSAVLDIAGSLTVYNRGTLETSSSTKIFKDAQVYIKGLTSFYKSSEVTVSGTITTVENSTLELRGIMSVSLSGMIDVSGHLTVGTASNVRCSGTLILTETATFTRFKTITLTKSGTFRDSRPTYEYKNMTVDILIDEPNVLRKGVDVSLWQGDQIDWKKAADSGVEFAMIRAGRGYISDEKPMIEDVCFRRNITEAQKYGIDVGVWFYSYATTVAEARAEAEFLVNIIKDYQIQYPVVFDLEDKSQEHLGKKKLTNIVEAFFEVIMENGYYPMLYSNKDWMQNRLDRSVVDKYALWLAQWNDVPTYDGGFYMWQYSCTGKVSGITDSDPNNKEMTVDLDYSYKDWPSIFRKYHLNNM